MPAKILILGGTAEAREIASRLLDHGHDVTTSLAGVTAKPLLPAGKIRSGGFGGADGLRDYLQANSIEVVLDVTHPFAAIISRNAFEAVKDTPVHLLRFERPAWLQIEGDQWISVANLNEAASVLPIGAKTFLTTGRKDLLPFFARPDLTGVIRTVEPLAELLPSGWQQLLDRPPHDFPTELSLFKAENFTHLISKNAGGGSTRAKLDVARELGIPVVMIQRPFKPSCETHNDVQALTKRLGT